jgi:hypothetical protein
MAGTKSKPAETGRIEFAGRLAWWLFLALAFALPLAQGNFVLRGASGSALLSDQFGLPKAFTLIALSWLSLAAWALWAAWSRRVVRWHWLLGVAAGYAAWALVTSATSLVAFLAVQLVDGSARMRRVCEVVVASGTLVALYALAQLANLDPLSWQAASFGARIFSTLGNPDVLGASLVLPFALALGLALAEERPRARLAWAACAAIIVVALVFSLVRLEWID